MRVGRGAYIPSPFSVIGFVLRHTLATVLVIAIAAYAIVRLAIGLIIK